MPKDEKSEQTQFTHDELDKIEEFPSLPYEIEFNIPVVKVQCGDVYATILTVEGEVYSWGINMYGQLGLKDSTVFIAMQPMRV